MSLPALLMLHKDGTVSVTDGLMFGGLPGSTTRMSPLHGVWERRRTFRAARDAS